MYVLSGITGNGFIYAAQHDAAAALDSVTWATTFQRDVIRGETRYGCVSNLSNPDVKIAVMDDVERIWTNAH